MADEQGAGEGGALGLQFDKVELATPAAAPSCARCSQAIEHEYFEAAGHVLCGRCGEQLGGAHGRGPFLRAAALGGGAALLGTIVWFAILKFSGREFGLLAIGVGLGRVLLAIASSGAFINLFNLVPVWQLDGGRGFAALTQRQRSVVAGLLWVLALVVGEGMLVVLAVACTARALIKGNAPEQGDNEVQMTYLGLVLGLTFLMLRAKP